MNYLDLKINKHFKIEISKNKFFKEADKLIGINKKSSFDCNNLFLKVFDCFKLLVIGRFLVILNSGVFI